VLSDHIFVLVFAVIYPLAGYFGFRRLLDRIAAGHSVSRPRLYSNTIAGHWVLFAIGVAIWTSEGRSLDLLGFGFRGDAGFLAGLFLTVACIGLLLGQIRMAAGASSELLRRIHEQFGSMVHLVPHDKSELARFSVLSITAGIVEETLWRGYLIWYLAQSLPVWAAALLSTVGFGLAHAYQGRESVARVMAVGAGFTALYLVSGSLWLSIVLHGAVDLLQGRFAFEVIARLRGGRESG
jgi:membrane protease YdiL (CAAX protease family)